LSHGREVRFHDHSLPLAGRAGRGSRRNLLPLFTSLSLSLKKFIEGSHVRLIPPDHACRTVIPDHQDSPDSSAPAIAAIALVVLFVVVDVTVFCVLTFRPSL